MSDSTTTTQQPNTPIGLREQFALELFGTQYNKLDPIIQLQIDTKIIEHSSSIIEGKIIDKFGTTIAKVDDFKLQQQLKTKLISNLFPHSKA